MTKAFVFKLENIARYDTILFQHCPRESCSLRNKGRTIPLTLDGGIRTRINECMRNTIHRNQLDRNVKMKYHEDRVPGHNRNFSE